MQPIERYGLVALVFLGITISAAYFWEPDTKGDPKDDAAEIARNDRTEAPGRRDFVGARTNPAAANQGKGLSASQRQELLALQGRKAEQQRAAQGGRREMLGDAFAPIASMEGGAKVENEPSPPADEPHVAETLEAPAETPRKLAERGPVDAPPLRATGSARIYTIQASDTLSEISMNELGTWTRWEEIVDLNPGLDPNSLKEGARIKLPARGDGAPASAKSAQASSASPSTSPSPSNGGPLHVVQKNESLWKIADLRLGDGERWKEIAALNPKINPDKLTVGMKLALPASAAKKAAGGAPSLAQAEPSTTTGKVR